MSVHQPITNIQKLETIANQLRQDVMNILVEAGSGHSGGPLGMADVFTVLYFAILRFDPKKPNWPDRDRVILSNGHICPIWYPTLAHAGFFPHKELASLRKINSRLQGHPHRGSLPGVENTGGPLGQGMSQAIGHALAGRLDAKDYHVYNMMSDAELQEGQNWEAIMFAGSRKLDNLTAVVDFNNIQIDGKVSDIMPIEPLDKKFDAFHWHVVEVDGHSMVDLIEAFNQAKRFKGSPTVILARTVLGQGVDFMENDYHWHGKPPTPPERDEAIRQLRQYGGRRWPAHTLDS